MTTRLEKKLKTRHNLMSAALMLVEQGQHFSNVSIREVAKNAQVVPTSFYRHFTGMDDLGLALVDELSLILRQLMRKARQENTDPSALVKTSVSLFVDHVYANRSAFLFMSQELTGGTPALREAIRSELFYFANELVVDLKRLNLINHLPLNVADQLCLQVIMTVAMNTPELLDVERGSEELVLLQQRIEAQIKVIFIGIAHWK